MTQSVSSGFDVCCRRARTGRVGCACAGVVYARREDAVIAGVSIKANRQSGVKNRLSPGR